MFKYHITSGKVLIPTDDFSMVKKNCEIIDATSAKTHLEYPNGVIMDVIVTIDGADITINKELIQNADGNYELKEKI
mgnify:CR=1 FL=1